MHLSLSSISTGEHEALEPGRDKNVTEAKGTKAGDNNITHEYHTPSSSVSASTRCGVFDHMLLHWMEPKRKLPGVPMPSRRMACVGLLPPLPDIPLPTDISRYKYFMMPVPMMWGCHHHHQRRFSHSDAPIAFIGIHDTPCRCYLPRRFAVIRCRSVPRMEESPKSWLPAMLVGDEGGFVQSEVKRRCLNSITPSCCRIRTGQRCGSIAMGLRFFRVLTP